jgi:hypothetical protein
MRDLRQRLRNLEQRRPQELPPLIMRENISQAEAEQMERQWIADHGPPGPLILTVQSPGRCRFSD